MQRPGRSRLQRTSAGRTRKRFGLVDGVEGGEDRGLAAEVDGRSSVESVDRGIGGLAAAGELLGDVPAGLGDRVDQDDLVAAGEEVLDAVDVGGDHGGGAVGGGGGVGAERDEEVAGRAVGAALAVVEGVGRDAGDPAGGEDDDGEVGVVEVGVDVADEGVAGGGGGGAGAGRGRGSAGRRCG